MRRNPRVPVASCRVDGKLRSEPVPARVEVLTAARELERVQKLPHQAVTGHFRPFQVRQRRGSRGITRRAAFACA